jgi:hypothetical protein
MAMPNALFFVRMACFTFSQSGPGDESTPCGEWLGTIPIDHLFFFGDLGIDICFVLNESSGGDWSYECRNDRLS